MFDLKSIVIDPSAVDPFKITNHDKEVLIAGGAIRAGFDKTPIADFDVFFKTSRAYDETLKTLLKQDFKIVFKCPEGLLTTLKDSQGRKVQLITKSFYSNEEHLLKSFDFTVCCFVYNGIDAFAYGTAIKDAREKNLVVNSLAYPVATLNRIIKYKNKGYKVGSAIEDIVERLLAAGADGNAFDLALYID